MKMSKTKKADGCNVVRRLLSVLTVLSKHCLFLCRCQVGGRVVGRHVAVGVAPDGRDSRCDGEGRRDTLSARKRDETENRTHSTPARH